MSRIAPPLPIASASGERVAAGTTSTAPLPTILFSSETAVDRTTLKALAYKELGYVHNFLGGHMRALKLHGSGDGTVKLEFGEKKLMLNEAKTGFVAHTPAAKSMSTTAGGLLPNLRGELGLDLKSETRPIVILSCYAAANYGAQSTPKYFAQDLSKASMSDVWALSEHQLSAPQKLGEMTSPSVNYNWQQNNGKEKSPITQALRFTPNGQGTPAETIPFDEFLKRARRPN